MCYILYICIYLNMSWAKCCITDVAVENKLKSKVYILNTYRHIATWYLRNCGSRLRSFATNSDTKLIQQWCRRVGDSCSRDVLSSVRVHQGFINDHCPLCVAAANIIDLGIIEPAAQHRRNGVVVVHHCIKNNSRSHRCMQLWFGAIYYALYWFQI